MYEKHGCKRQLVTIANDWAQSVDSLMVSHLTQYNKRISSFIEYHLCLTVSAQPREPQSLFLNTPAPAQPRLPLTNHACPWPTIRAVYPALSFFFSSKRVGPFMLPNGDKEWKYIFYMLPFVLWPYAFSLSLICRVYSEIERYIGKEEKREGGPSGAKAWPPAVSSCLCFKKREKKVQLERRKIDSYKYMP